MHEAMLVDVRQVAKHRQTVKPRLIQMKRLERLDERPWHRANAAQVSTRLPRIVVMLVEDRELIMTIWLPTV